MAPRRPSLVSIMWVFRVGAVDDRTTRGGLGRPEEVALEWVEIEIAREQTGICSTA